MSVSWPTTSPITRADKGEAIAAYRAYARREALADDSLLAELVRQRRREEAALLADEPGQATVAAFEAAFAGLRDAAHAAWIFPIFQAIVRAAPAVERLSPFSFGSGAAEARPFHERAFVELAAVYGPQWVVKDWDGSAASTLLHLCEGWMSTAVGALVAAGADPRAVDHYGQTPLAGLSAIGELSPAVLRALAPAGVATSVLERFLDASTGKAPSERLAVLTTAAELGVVVDSGEPIVSLAAEPDREARLALLEALERPGMTGGTRKDALLAAARGGSADALRHWIELAGARPGETYTWKGKGQTLLHVRCAALAPGSDEAAVAAEQVRAIELLLSWGESTAAKNQAKATPVDLWARAKSAFSPAWRRRIDRVLGVEAKGGPTLADRFEDPSLAYGVISALLRGRQLKEAALTKLAKAAMKGVDREDCDALEQAVLGAVHELPVAGLDFGAVKVLSWGWDEPFFRWFDKTIGDENGGESDVLPLRSLAGIAALPALETLELTPDTYAGGVRDLAPLAGHPTLAVVALPTAIDDASPLLALPALKQVRDARGALSDEARASLAGREVAITAA